MQHIPGVIVDKYGNFVDIVAVSPDGCIFEYELQKGQQLIKEDVDTAIRIFKRLWDGKRWIEMATPEEIEEARTAVSLEPMGLYAMSISENISFMMKDVLENKRETNDYAHLCDPALIPALLAYMQGLERRVVALESGNKKMKK